MSKTDPEILADAVVEQLITFLGSGNLNQQQITRSLDFTGKKIHNLDRLKALHFVLHDEVVEYVEQLHGRLRRLKTANRQRQHVSRGEVRGRIDWKATKQQRYQQGYNDPTLFVVNQPEVEYNIPENRVVKKLLAAIAEPLREDVENIDQDWRDAWTDASIVDLEQTLAQNVYLSRLPDVEDITLTKRDLNRARTSRQVLYWKAHDLYRLYDDLMNNRFEREEVRDLLQETLVTPAADYRLFELFCLFGVIRRLQMQEDLRLQRVEPGSGAVAVMENEEQLIEVYYDEGGPLSFFDRYPSSDELRELDIPSMFVRQAEAIERHAKATETFLGRGSNQSFYDGRPDVLILKYQIENDDKTLDDVILGEFKYTNSSSTFSTGLRELLEYLHLAKNNGEYLFGAQSVSVTGLICTDGVMTDHSSFENIHHLTTSTLQSYLTDEIV